MNTLRSIIILCLCLSIIDGKCQTTKSDSTNVDIGDSAIYNQLLKMDFNKYIGKTSVKRFLQDVGTKYNDSTLGFAPPSYLRYITFSYSKKLWVEIQVNEFRNMSSWSPEHKWDIEKFKKEKIGAIRFKYLGECVKCVTEKKPNLTSIPKK